MGASHSAQWIPGYVVSLHSLHLLEHECFERMGVPLGTEPPLKEAELRDYYFFFLLRSSMKCSRQTLGPSTGVPRYPLEIGT